MKPVIGHLILAEKIQKNENKNYFIINNMSNHFSLKTFPSVAISEILVQVWFYEHDADNYNLEIHLKDSNDKLIVSKKLKGIEPNFKLYNMPYVETLLNIRFLVEEEDIFKCILINQESTIAVYPIVVSIESKKMLENDV